MTKLIYKFAYLVKRKPLFCLTFFWRIDSVLEKRFQKVCAKYPPNGARLTFLLTPIHFQKRISTFGKQNDPVIPSVLRFTSLSASIASVWAFALS